MAPELLDTIECFSKSVELRLVLENVAVDKKIKAKFQINDYWAPS